MARNRPDEQVLTSKLTRQSRLASDGQIGLMSTTMKQNDSPAVALSPKMPEQVEESTRGSDSHNLDVSPASAMKVYKNNANSNNINHSVGLGSLVISKQKEEETVTNEPLVAGFALLRIVQLLNFDIYYLGLGAKCNEAAKLNRLGNHEAAARLQSASNGNNHTDSIDGNNSSPPPYYRTFLDELAECNPLQRYIDRWHILDTFCKFLKVYLSLMAILMGIDKTISNTILCLFTHIETKGSQELSNGNMGLFVLILVNLSSIYILFSTIFRGHLIWNLFSQRLFLVSRRFQCKTMAFLLIFIYLEYVISISFVNNLYEWDFTSNNIQSDSYSVFANLRIFLTEQDEDNHILDMVLTILQFARGIIRISPYVTINYAIICLKEHISTIRNQKLLTQSLKKRHKLKLVVARQTRSLRKITEGQGQGTQGRKKRVIFATEKMVATNKNVQRPSIANWPAHNLNRINNQLHQSNHSNNGSLNADSARDTGNSENRPPASVTLDFVVSKLTAANGGVSHAAQGSSTGGQKPNNEVSFLANNKSRAIINRSPYENSKNKADTQPELAKSNNVYLTKISDFDELESYITNLYIFVDRLNRCMSSQGLTLFFIVHNLVITVSLIIPEAAKGGVIMAYVVRFLIIVMGLLPFVFGQSLNGQLEQLSKQIDRIIILQQFSHRRRDNLVRIRELIHDVRVNCGGMINFNVATGIKYLVVAFASAFFIEQEHYKLTRRH